MFKKRLPLQLALGILLVGCANPLANDLGSNSAEQITQSEILPNSSITPVSKGQTVPNSSITPTSKGQTVPSSSITPVSKGQTIIRGRVVIPSTFSLLSYFGILAEKPLPIFEVEAKTLANELLGMTTTQADGSFELDNIPNDQLVLVLARAKDNPKIVFEALADLRSISQAETILELNTRTTGITRMMLDQQLEETFLSKFDLRDLETNPVLKEIVEEVQEFVEEFFENEVSEALEELEELNQLLEKSRKGLLDHQSLKELEDSDDEKDDD